MGRDFAVVFIRFLLSLEDMYFEPIIMTASTLFEISISIYFFRFFVS